MYIFRTSNFGLRGTDIVRNMSIEPNEYIWGALLNSCRMYIDMDIAEETASQVLTLK